MGALIWIGNTLLPRGVVYGAAAIIALAVIAIFTILTDDRKKSNG